MMNDAVPKQLACRVCGGPPISVFQGREMMFGLREKFEYFECDACKCVQISEYPEDIARHYPTDYYAYTQQAAAAPQGKLSRLKELMRRLVMEHSATRSIRLRMPSMRNWLSGEPYIRFCVERFPDASTRMLDVGCGAGNMVRSLRHWGFKNAEGVDPYIANHVLHRGKTLVWKRQLSEMAPSYHCISFHHSLEHMPNQAGVLADARRLLAPGGVIIIRIPVAGTAAWRTYKENWVQLDPPRHFYLHSEASLRLLAQQSGLVVDAISYDSDGFQFWGSELYLKDISLWDERSPARGSHAVFSVEMLAGYERRAGVLNSANDGDQVIAILRAAS